MLPEHARADLKDEIRRFLKAFADVSGSDFSRTDLGPLGFESSVPVFERLLRFINDVVSQVEPDLLPDPKLQEFRDTLVSVHNRFLAVKSFTADEDSDNPFRERDILAEQFRALHDSLFTHFAPFVACASRPKDLLGESRTAAERVTRALTELEKEKRADVERLLDDLRGLASKAKEAAQETGVATHSGIFSAVADAHEKIARLWLVTVVCLLCVAGGAAVWSLVWTFNNRAILATFEVVPATQFTVAKLLIASLLLSAIVWAARMYRAHRHNVVVNRHRQHALSTFETFVKATADQDTKNAVLLQTTQSIFAPQATGYMGEEAEASGATKVIEVFRGLAEGKK